MSIDSLAPRLARQPTTKLVPKKSASVAVVLRDLGGGEEVLLIRRAERDSDPWSGQVAFPGGMVSQADTSFEATARRETAEEVGLDISSPAAEFLGYMREFRTHTRNVAVVPAVFKILAAQEPNPNQEVASWEWASLKELASEEARSSYLLPKSGGEVPFPCIMHRGLVIWGLTERILAGVLKE